MSSLSHDAFTGKVYASLETLEVIEVDPFTGTTSPFQTMPGKGRVAVSPDGNLWFYPVKFAGNGTLAPWPLPETF